MWGGGLPPDDGGNVHARVRRLGGFPAAHARGDRAAPRHNTVRGLQNQAARGGSVLGHRCSQDNRLGGGTAGCCLPGRRRYRGADGCCCCFRRPQNKYKNEQQHGHIATCTEAVSVRHDLFCYVLLVFARQKEITILTHIGSNTSSKYQSIHGFMRNNVFLQNICVVLTHKEWIWVNAFWRMRTFCGNRAVCCCRRRNAGTLQRQWIKKKCP